MSKLTSIPRKNMIRSIRVRLFPDWAAHISDVSPDVLAQLSASSRESVQIAVAKHANTPLDILAQLAASRNPNVQRAIVERSDVAARILMTLLASPDQEIRKQALSNLMRRMDRYRWRPDLLFNEAQKAQLGEINRQAKLHVLKLVSSNPRLYSQFARQAIDFQARHTILHDHDRLISEFSDVPFWYALALYQCAYLVNDEFPISDTRQEIISSTMTFLLEQVSQQLNKALLGDVIVIHLLCDSLLNWLGNLQDQIQQLLAQQNKVQVRLKNLPGQQIKFWRLRNKRSTQIEREGLERELKELEISIAQIRSLRDQYQRLCSTFAHLSPLTWLLHPRNCMRVLAQEENMPEGLGVIACNLNAEGLQRRLVQEMVDACVDMQHANFQIIGRLLKGIYEAAIVQGLEDQQQRFQGFLFLLRFYQMLGLAYQGVVDSFINQMPEQIEERQRYYENFVYVLEPLRKAYNLIANNLRVLGPEGIFRQEYEHYRNKGWEEVMDRIRLHIHNIRRVGPKIEEKMSL